MCPACHTGQREKNCFIPGYEGVLYSMIVRRLFRHYQRANWFGFGIMVTEYISKDLLKSDHLPGKWTLTLLSFPPAPGLCQRDLPQGARILSTHKDYCNISVDSVVKMLNYDHDTSLYLWLMTREHKSSTRTDWKDYYTATGLILWSSIALALCSQLCFLDLHDRFGDYYCHT